MNPRIPIAIVCCLIAAMVSLPTAATASRSDWFTGYEINYLDTYEQAYKADLNPGRNIVDDGLANGEPASRAQVIESTDRMEAWLNPPEPAPVAEVSSPAPSYSTTTTSGGCTGMEAESGSAGYSAYNPSSGATGCYQIIPSTAAAFSCDLSTPAGQDSCAAAICAGQGSGAWSSSGANPC